MSTLGLFRFQRKALNGRHRIERSLMPPTGTCTKTSVRGFVLQQTNRWGIVVNRRKDHFLR
nr:hypothetical protein [Mariniblastus sp.]